MHPSLDPSPAPRSLPARGTTRFGPRNRHPGPPYLNTILGYTYNPVAHIDRDGRKLLARVRRIRGQIQGIEKALEGESDCTSLLQTIAATRGALNGLMAQIVEGHIREHVIDPSQPPTPEQVAAADELVDVVKAYLK
ncbi:MAG: metal/formaldehyde-sensitive transcriptional repressor [bacterium]|nr:hypothetical protein [Deltaproteobacteria bacterium]MCP4238937.1 metal/formaldehyde-sensitive transcriptional repressor [bacterium]